jgi:hypothetical protein
VSTWEFRLSDPSSRFDAAWERAQTLVVQKIGHGPEEPASLEGCVLFRRLKK